MTETADRSSFPRRATTAVADALLVVDALLAEAACAGRRVRYTLEDDATALTREEVEAWLVGAEAEGITRIRYGVTLEDAATVHVVMGAVDAPASP